MEAGGPAGAPTFDDPAQQAWDGVQLRHLVQGEVGIAGGVGLAEDVPQVGGLVQVLHRLGLRARFKVVIYHSSVSHQADSEGGAEERGGADEALQARFLSLSL